MEHVNQPTEDQAAMLARIHELFSGVTGGQQDFSGAFNQALQANADMQAPAAMPVPGRVNPLGGMASIFAATLADQMGARGSTAAAQQNIEQTNAASDAAAHENFARSEAFNTSKQLQRMGILMKLGEAKAEALAKGTDHAAYEAQIKANMMMSERSKKLQEDMDVRAAEQAHKYRMDEIIAAKTATGADKAAAAQTANDKNMLQFQKDIGDINQKKGNISPPGTTGWGWWEKKTDASLNAAGIAQIRSRSTAAATSAHDPALREMALATYLDTLRDADGRVNSATPEYSRFHQLLKKVLPKVEDRNAFVETMGY